MDPRYQPPLDWIADQHAAMAEQVARWSAINTGSLHLAGLARLADELARDAEPLDAELSRTDLPPLQAIGETGRPRTLPLGQALVLRKRPHAPRQALLAIHYDTVFPPDHPFQNVRQLPGGVLAGPGVADAKGGIAVLLTALAAFEQSDVADDLGWQVVLNPDEEFGSPGSAPLLATVARQADVGLVFEPSLPDGVLVGARKGSGNFTLVVRGRAAHAGREFHRGRNAVHALAQAVTELDDLNRQLPGVTVNVGRIVGGGPVNVVPDLAVCRFNIRIHEESDQQRVEHELTRLLGRLQWRDGYQSTLQGGFGAPVKPLDAPTRTVLEQIAGCGRDLGLKLTWRPSGGVCDGNRLAAAGLPTVDTLGPRGSGIHSRDEQLILPSLTERARLAALLLMKYAAGELEPPPKIINGGNQSAPG
ncbi:MAG: hydrolase [Phycisphaeraceae bacterium]